MRMWNSSKKALIQKWKWNSEWSELNVKVEQRWMRIILNLKQLKMKFKCECEGI